MKLKTLHIVIYLVVFFAAWSVRELVIQPLFLSPLSDVASAAIGQIIKLLVWTLPAVLLIRRFRDDVWISLKEMFTNKMQWRRDAYILVMIIAIPLARAVLFWLEAGEITIQPDFVPANLIGAVVFVGITEEIVFRGFLLNAFLKRMKMQYAVALDAVLFTLIHFPIWIYNGMGLPGFLFSSFAVAVLSVGFAYSFIKTKNIFVPMALHMVWNLSIHLFVEGL